MLRRSNIFYSFWNSVGPFSSSTLPLLIQKYSSKGFFYILVPPFNETLLSPSPSKINSFIYRLEGFSHRGEFSNPGPEAFVFLGEIRGREARIPVT